MRNTLLAVVLATALSPLVHAQNDKAGRFYEDALKRYENKDLSGSIVQLKNALREERSFLPALLLLGKASLQDSNPNAAEAAFNEALRLGVNRSEVVVLLARALVAQGKQAQMLQDPNLQIQGLAALPQSKLLLVRGAAQTDLGDDRAAMASIEQARQLNASDPDVWLAEVPIRIRSGAFDTALAAVDRALKVAPNHADAIYQRGSIFHSRNQLTAAKAEYDKTLSLQPDHLEALIARAGIALDSRQVDKAMLDIAQLRKTHPKDPRADYMSAVIAEARGDRKASQLAMRRVAELLDPVSIEFLRFRPQLLMLAGLAHYALGEPQKAKPYLEHLIKQQPRNPSSKLLAQILFDERQIENGIQVLETYLRSAPHDVQAIALMASGHSAQNRNAKATQLMTQALASMEGPELRSVLGQALMRSGKFSDAQRELENAWKRNPTSAPTGTALSMLYLRMHEANKAVAVARAVLNLTPNAPSSHHLLGMAQAAANDTKGARASFKQALVLEKDLVEAHMSLARLDAREGNAVGARQRLEALAQQNDKLVEPMLELAGLSRSQNQLDDAERWLERAATVASLRELRPHYALIDLNLSRNQPSKASEAAKVLLSKSPEDPMVLIAYARTQLANEDLSGAKPTLVQASRRMAFDPDGLSEIAGLQLIARDLSGASYTLTKVLEGAPDTVRALILQASIDMQQGDIKTASARVARVLTLRPRDAVSHLLAAELALAKSQPAEALASLRRAHELQPSTATTMRLFLHLAQFDKGNSAEQLAEGWLRKRASDNTVRRALAEHLAARERWPSARVVYEELLRRNENDAQALNNLAMVLLRSNETVQALKLTERAIKVAPSNALVIDTHAWVLHHNGQHERALSSLRDARLRAPDNAEIRYHLAAVLAKLGRTSEATAELKAALEAPNGLESVKDAQNLLRTLK
jgi:cellulose synthase operon protein C